MTLGFIVGFIVWILCVFFVLAIIKGGHRVRGNRYEHKLYLQSENKRAKRRVRRKLRMAEG